MTPARGVLTWHRIRVALGAAVVLWVGTCAFGVYRPLPDGVSTASAWFDVPDIEFLYDLTYTSPGDTVSEQTIFDRVMRMIDGAQHFAVIDMFLFNGEHGGDRAYLPLADRLTNTILAKRDSAPDVTVSFTTDEINNFYGAYEDEHQAALRNAGVTVVLTKLERLRDSNPLYSAVWRIAFRWFGTGGPGWLPHPLTSSGRKVTARAYLKLLNMKANHRKLIVTDEGCLVTSANPHDASSFHSNIAWVAHGGLCGAILTSERSVARFSGAELTVPQPEVDEIPSVSTGGTGQTARARFLTEGKIKREIVAAIDRATGADSIDVAMFYLSDRGVIDALLAAAARGVPVRLILDPNKDAFGRAKGGIPNREVAYELRERSDRAIQVRWYDTHGEQFHTKLVVIRGADGMTAFGGSANLTRRNVDDYNLEADLEVQLPRAHPTAGRIAAYFARVWSNDGGHHTVPFETYRGASRLKRIAYRVQEFTGLCSY